MSLGIKMELLAESWKRIQTEALVCAKQHKSQWLELDQFSGTFDLEQNYNICPDTHILLELAKHYLQIQEAKFVSTDRYGTLHYKQEEGNNVAYFLGIKIPDPENCLIVIDKKPMGNKKEGNYVRLEPGKQLVSFNFTDATQIYLVVVVKELLAELFPPSTLNIPNISH